MAKTRRDKFDLFTLVVKNMLIGTDLVMEKIGATNDEEVLEVKDFYCDYATSEIHIEFVDNSEGSFNLKDKFVVEIDQSYKSIKSKIKRKAPKR